MAQSDALRDRFIAERESGMRSNRDRSWLFGKGAGVPPAERRRAAAEAKAGLDGDVPA